VGKLPRGLRVDTASGRISGVVKKRGTYQVVLRAKNKCGNAEKKFNIVVGDRIALTPPMGWNHWNCWAQSIDQDKVMRAAKAMVSSGLINHGWSYVNIDDTWQGARGGTHNALQGNEKFPDLKKLCDDIHDLGLKVGIYSSPWITSYARCPGGSSNSPKGTWTTKDHADVAMRLGKYSFAVNDAAQWAEWGIDYLKYDWWPNDIPHAKMMGDALRNCGRDIVYSISNTADFTTAAELAAIANCWRTTWDIVDYWDNDSWMMSVSEIGFTQDKWVPYAGPGHWNDPDMLVLGHVGWGPTQRPCKLTPAEQCAHFSLWCMLSAPLLLGCDLEALDEFTLAMLSNDEVIAINQDALGRQAARAMVLGSIDVYKKELEDGGWALGFFNRGDTPKSATFHRLLSSLGLPVKVHVRDLWQQADLPEITDGKITIAVDAHGVVLLKITRR